MRRIWSFAVSVVLLAACGPREPNDLGMRLATLSYRFEIRADSLPPFANEDVNFTVTVLDRKTGQPVQEGEGQIYGQFQEGGRPHPWDGFVYGPAVGTYHAKLRFAIGGRYAMGLRFHRDSLSPLEKLDWQQIVLPERDIPKKPPS